MTSALPSALPSARLRNSSRPPSRPGTPKDQILRSAPSLTRVSSSASSLNSLFAAASLASPTSIDEDPKSLICRAFVPHVAVHVSDDTNELAQEKGFASFKELLRPYGEDLQGRLTVRDSHGVSNSYDDFGVRFVGLDEVAAGAEHWETAGHRAMNGGPATPRSSASKIYLGGNIEEVEELIGACLNEDESGCEDDTPSDQAVYFKYLKRLLSALPVSPHETFSHPVACVIAISSRNRAPIESLRNLYASGNQVDIPAYVSADYLRYYVLVHDEDRDDVTKSMALFDQMKKHFGLHCHLLRLRSGGRTVVTDDDAVQFPSCQWVSAAEELANMQSKDDDEDLSSPLYLPDSDASAIRTMVREMTQVSVVPFMERCIATWNDQVASRRKGISGRFISISKRYFSSSSSRSSTSSNYDHLTSSYPPSSDEAQMRKLADYAFMLRDWKLAHSTYDLLRTDFGNDKAWRHHAGAQEMTIISLVLSGVPITSKVRNDTIDPHLDLACYSYVSRCAAAYSALRCLLVAVELLRLRGGGAVDEASKWAIRARELSSLGRIGHALITERVGDCYAAKRGAGAAGIGARRRKAAMWKTLAAGEWCALGKIVQARRCLDRALPVYEGSRWDGVGNMVERLKVQAGYTPLVNVDGEERRMDEEEVEGQEVERVEMGNKRRSVLMPPAGEIGEEMDGKFVES